MNKLPTLIERWEYLVTKGEDVINTYHKYVQLFVTPLELGQFIPCKDGEPMEKPKEKTYCIQGVEMGLSKKYREYQKALDSVLFKGDYEVVIDGQVGRRSTQRDTYLSSGDDIIASLRGEWYFWGKRTDEAKTIEDLINAGCELRPTEALKTQLGLTLSN